MNLEQRISRLEESINDENIFASTHYALSRISNDLFKLQGQLQDMKSQSMTSTSKTTLKFLESQVIQAKDLVIKAKKKLD